MKVFVGFHPASVGRALLLAGVILRFVVCGVCHAETPDIVQLLALPGGDVFAVSDARGGLFRSRDAGRRWEPVEAMGERFIHGLAAEPGGRLYALTGEGVLLSGDGGTTWRLVTDAGVALLAFSHDGSRSIFRCWGCAPQPGSTGREEDSPSPFPKAFSGRPTAIPSAVVQGVMFDASGTAWAGSWGGGVARSEDGGASWVERSEGLSNRQVLCLLEGGGATVFAGTYGGGLFRTDNAGESWEAVAGGFAGRIVTGLCRGREGMLCAATRESGVWISEDGGTSWHRPVEPPAPGPVYGLAVTTGDTILAGVRGAGLFRSVDRGATWRAHPFAYTRDVRSLAVMEDGRVLVSVAGLGVLRSGDGVGAWRGVRLEVPLGAEVILASRGGMGCVAATEGSGVFMSMDAGETWAPASGGLEEKGVNCLALTEAGLVLAGAQSGVYALAPGEPAWRLLCDKTPIHSLAVTPGGAWVGWNVLRICSSGDRGVTWLEDGFSTAGELGVALNGWLVTERRFLGSFYSLDGGATWDELTDASGVRLAETYVRFDPVGGGAFLAVRLDGGVDLVRQGEAGCERETIMQGGEDVRCAGGSLGGALYLGTRKGLRRSTDAGRTWTHVDVWPEEGTP